MKKLFVILFFSLPAFCFGQATNPLLTSKYGGVYSWKSKTTKDRGGVVYVYPETNSTILFFMGLDGGEPSYNSGVSSGRIKISNGVGIYNNEDLPDCKFEFRFVEDKLIVRTVEDDGCLFGAGLGAGGEYKRESSKIPEYYEIYGERFYFKDDRIGGLTEELQNFSSDTQKINFPENNFDALLTRFGNKEKNVAEYYNWLSQIVFLDDLVDDGDYSAFVTANCLEYILDVIDYYLGLNPWDDKKTLKEKWESQYDLKYSNFSGFFENGNGGWMTKKLTKIEYLGELNNGDWFKLTINGGIFKNDYSITLIRIIKIVKEGNKFYIDNFLSLSDG